MAKKKQPDAPKRMDLHVQGLRAEVMEQPICQTLEQNYSIMDSLECLHELELPLLVGISRKSMISRLLHTDASGALNGTTALNTIALLKGASILRVHDVRECVEAVRIVGAMRADGSSDL